MTAQVSDVSSQLREASEIVPKVMAALEGVPGRTAIVALSLSIASASITTCVPLAAMIELIHIAHAQMSRKATP